MRTNLLHLQSTNVLRQFNGERTTNNAETKKKKGYPHVEEWI